MDTFHDAQQYGPWGGMEGDLFSGQGMGEALGGLGGFNESMAKSMGALSGYQAKRPDIDRQNFADAIANSQKYSQGVQGQQGALAQQLMAQSQGQGPNPAMEQLRQTTGEAQRQNTGMIASQKGVNPAMAARMASQNSALTGQQASGQAATMRAQQQLGAQGQLSGLYGQMGQQGMSQQQILQGAQAAQNNAITAGVNATQGINAKTAMQNAIQRGLISSSNMNNLSGMIRPTSSSMAHGGEVKKYDGGGMATMDSPPPSGGGGGGGMSSMMSLLPLLAMAYKGGQINKMGDGGEVHWSVLGSPPVTGGDEKDNGGGDDDDETTPDDDNSKRVAVPTSGSNAPPATSAAVNPNPPTMMPAAYKGGQSPFGLMGSGSVSKYANGGQAGPQSFAAQYMKNGLNMKQGGGVPGQAKVKGDNLKNDTQPALLSPGEIVIPRSISQGEDAPERSAEFVRAILSRKGKKK